MPAPKDMPCEIRLYVSEKIHSYAKATASERGNNIAAYVRDLIIRDMERKERSVQCRSTDFLIKAMAKKMGVEQPDSEGENSAEKEG